MYRGYWSVLAALVGIAVFSWGLGVYHASLNDLHQQRYPSYRHADDRPVGIEPALPAVSNPKPFEYRRPCHSPEGKAESELCAQWRAAYAGEDSAWWEKWGFWIGVVGSALLLWQITLTRQAVEDTSEATDAMLEANKIAKAAQRAWVALDIDPQLFRPVGNDALYLRLYFIAKNVGASPATHFEMKNAIFFLDVDGNAQEIGEKMERMIEEWRRDKFPKQNWSLAPGDTETDPWWGSVESPEFQWQDGPFALQQSIQPVLLSAAFYRTASNPGVVQTTWRSWYLHARVDGQVQSKMLNRSYNADALCAEPFRTSAVHEEHPENEDNRPPR